MSFVARSRELQSSRWSYCGRGREPFFRLAGEYLPDDPDAVVVDVGCGNGAFADLLGLGARYAHLHLLEGNPQTVALLAPRYPGAVLYRCPDPLPFAAGAVAFLHCSHMIEHLSAEQLLAFLGECDRVLRPGGVLAVSTPLLWDRFYEDLSHVKPYGPGIFASYLCGGADQRSAATVSRHYRTETLVYRTRFRPPLADLGVGNRHAPLDLLVQGLKKLACVLGFGFYERTGYTIVLRKQAPPLDPADRDRQPLQALGGDVPRAE